MLLLLYVFSNISVLTVNIKKSLNECAVLLNKMSKNQLFPKQTLSKKTLFYSKSIRAT